MKNILLVFVIVIMSLSCSQQAIEESRAKVEDQKPDWKSNVEKTLKTFGHRNWIVVADAAYPEQSNPAINTITIDAGQLAAVEYVNRLIEKAGHVDATIFLDKEIKYVPEENAKGIEKYRTELSEIFQGKTVETMLHEDIIRQLDESAKLFNVLIIKTDLALPYTSVFFRLECGYWNEESENQLRSSLSLE